MITSLLFASFGPPPLLSSLPPPVILAFTTALPRITTLFSLALPLFFAFPPKIWWPPVTVAESIITLFLDTSPLCDSPA